VEKHVTEIPTLDDVMAAQGRLLNVAIRTPLVRSEKLNALTGAADIYLKPEMLQRTGSFKFRGAYNRLLLYAHEHRNKHLGITPEAAAHTHDHHGHDHEHHDHAHHHHPAVTYPPASVVAFSSGNHAQGVAAAAQMLGINAAIVMPSDAPALKITRTKELGGEVILYDRARESREEIAERLATERDAIVVPSFNDPHIIAGQGTAGLEIIEDLCMIGTVADMFVCCCGGGGLASGCALGFESLVPDCEIVVVEPEHYDDVTRSLAADDIIGIDGFAPTLCDALQTPQMGELTFAILSSAGARGVVVTDAEVKQAMKFAFEEFKLVVEPGGAVALAAVMSGKVDVKGKVIVVMLSGGNVDPATFAACLA
jgi:threonine dehydratase